MATRKCLIDENKRPKWDHENISHCLSPKFYTLKQNVRNHIFNFYCQLIQIFHYT